MRDDLYRMNRLDYDIQQYSFSDIDLIKLVNMKNMSALFFGVCKCMCLCMHVYVCTVGLTVGLLVI